MWLHGPTWPYVEINVDVEHLSVVKPKFRPDMCRDVVLIKCASVEGLASNTKAMDVLND